MFAAYLTNDGFVAPCVFPNSDPYVDNWTFTDYSLFFISCLYDYTVHTDDKTLVLELYHIAEEQIRLVSADLDALLCKAFIDWCKDLEKNVAAVGVYIYVLKQFKKLTQMLSKTCEYIDLEIKKATSLLLSNYSKESRLFVAKSGQISWHSQIWAVLSGVLTKAEAVALLEKTENINPEYIMHTPYMMHYYLEALYECGLKEKAISFIKDYWGKIADYGFDCCPEIFNPQNHMESPYNAPEINSACHAWSCTPAYWIIKYNKGEKNEHTKLSRK